MEWINDETKEEKIKELKGYGLIVLSQILAYVIICINFRAIAQANYLLIGISDCVYAFIAYNIIKRVASDDTKWGATAYAIGCTLGGLLGTYLSTILEKI